MTYGATDSIASAAQSQNDVLQPAADRNAEDEQLRLYKRTQRSLKSFYERNLGLFLVFLAQTCGSVVCLPLPLREMRYR